MIQGLRTVAVGVLSGMLISCGATGERTMEPPDLGSDRLSVESIERMRPIHEFATPEGWSFRMQETVDLAAVGPDRCRIVVADAGDRAIHWFGGAPPTHSHSLYLGGRDSSIVGRLSTLAASSKGSLAVVDQRRNTVVRVSKDGVVVGQNRFPEEALRESKRAGGDIALDAEGNLYETFEARSRLEVSGSLNLPGPPIRVWGPGGNLVNRYGVVLAESDPLFAGKLSWGRLALHADTLWFARASDGRLLAFPKGGSETPVRTIGLPILHSTPEPTASILPDPLYPDSAPMVRVAMMPHSGHLAISPSGDFFVEQLRGDLTSVLTAVRADGSRVRIFDLGAERIHALAATDHVVYVAISPLDDPRRTQVIGYRNPFAGPSVNEVTNCNATELDEDNPL